jgi:DNA end-binding protein Ku
MLLTTLHWPDEIRSPKELDLPEEAFEFKPAEIRMAEQLIEAMTESFDPTKYKDEYREALLKVIEAKIEGVEIAQPEPAAESTNLVDLMKLLEASVKAATDQRNATTEAPVSVAQAKAARASKSAAAKTKATTEASKGSDSASAAAAHPADSRVADARPARRRKSA